MTSPSDTVHGSPDDLVTIHFVHQGTAYTIDLDPAEAEEFDRAMAPFINAGRRVGGNAPRPGHARR